MAVPLSRTTPESQGFSSNSILTFIEEVERKDIELHSLQLLRNGYVVAEGWWAPYRQNDVHLLYSLSKSFTSTAIGIAIQEGLLTLDDPVVSFFPDDLPTSPSENLLRMRVRDLLTMSTGHDSAEVREFGTEPGNNWVRSFLAKAVPFEPGTHFLYNSGATYILSAILHSLTDQSLLEYLRPRLLNPLGIEESTWETCPRGIQVGGWGLSVTTESISKFGQLYLQMGRWEGCQLIPTSWVDLATSKQVENGDDPKSDWQQGYGFQFWRCRNNAYRGDGAFGQFCLVVPDREMVVAITASENDMQAVLNLIWEHFIPKAETLPEDLESSRRLSLRMSTLSLLGPPNTSNPSPTIGSNYSGTYDEGDPIQIDLFEDGTISLAIAGGKQAVAIQSQVNQWSKGMGQLSSSEAIEIAAWASWQSSSEVIVIAKELHSPGTTTFTLQFDGDICTIHSRSRGRFAPENGPIYRLVRHG